MVFVWIGFNERERRGLKTALETLGIEDPVFLDVDRHDAAFDSEKATVVWNHNTARSDQDVKVYNMEEEWTSLCALVQRPVPRIAFPGPQHRRKQPSSLGLLFKEILQPFFVPPRHWEPVRRNVNTQRTHIAV